MWFCFAKEQFQGNLAPPCSRADQSLHGSDWTGVHRAGISAKFTGAKGTLMKYHGSMAALESHVFVWPDMGYVKYGEKHKLMVPIRGVEMSNQSSLCEDRILCFNISR